MGRKLYVGNLPFSATESELRDYFAQIGTPESVAIVTDRLTGRSRGFGFVEMQSDDDAALAAERLHGKDFKGRALTINEARARDGRPGGGGAFAGPRRS
jgi:cold-inducible RNA-binding protein